MRTLRLILISSTIGAYVGASLVLHWLADPVIDHIQGKR